jgi:enediyne biosynthesis protein E4
LLNQSRSWNRNHWLLVRLEASHGNRFAMGATVEVRQRGRVLLRRAHTDASYLSANDIRVHFGLGEDAKIEELVVHWPDGKTESWDKIQADQIVTIHQGAGKAVAT